jgi:hypothetical protein
MLYFILCVVTEPCTSSLHSAGIQFPSYVRLSAPIVDLMFMCYLTGMDSPRTPSPPRSPSLPRTPSPINSYEAENWESRLLQYGASPLPAGQLEVVAVSRQDSSLEPGEYLIKGVVGQSFNGPPGVLPKPEMTFQVWWADGTLSWELAKDVMAPASIHSYYERLGLKPGSVVSKRVLANQLKLVKDLNREGTEHGKVRRALKESQYALARQQLQLDRSHTREGRRHSQIARMVEERSEQAAKFKAATLAAQQDHHNLFTEFTDLQEHHEFEVERLSAAHQEKLATSLERANKENEECKDMLDSVRANLVADRKRYTAEIADLKEDIKESYAHGVIACARGEEACARNLEALEEAAKERAKLNATRHLFRKMAKALTGQAMGGVDAEDDEAVIASLFDSHRGLYDGAGEGLINQEGKGYSEPISAWYECADRDADPGEVSLPAPRFEERQTKMWSDQNEDALAWKHEVNREEHSLHLMRKDLKRCRDEMENVQELEARVELKAAELAMKKSRDDVFESCRMVSSTYQRQRRAQNNLLLMKEKAAKSTEAFKALLQRR